MIRGVVVLALCMINISLHGVAQDTLETFKQWMNPSSCRYHTFRKLFDLMEREDIRVIVETGTTRTDNLSQMFQGDGGSTLLFADWALKHHAKMFSVDISPEAFAVTRKFFSRYRDALTTVCSDSVAFLENFHEKIDVLYLDSFDFDEKNPSPSQEHHLKEIIAAYPKLHDCLMGAKGSLLLNIYSKKVGVLCFNTIKCFF